MYFVELVVDYQSYSLRGWYSNDVVVEEPALHHWDLRQTTVHVLSQGLHRFSHGLA